MSREVTLSDLVFEWSNKLALGWEESVEVAGFVALWLRICMVKIMRIIVWYGKLSYCIRRLSGRGIY